MVAMTPICIPYLQKHVQAAMPGAPDAEPTRLRRDHPGICARTVEGGWILRANHRARNVPFRDPA
jgi:hypothetical protein